MHAVLAIAVAAILAVAAPAHAQDWPQRPVTIVVPFAAGGSADLLARILQQHMQVKFGVPFVVENRSGAGGSIGTGVVAKAAPDGYTLLLGTLSGNVINGFLYTKLPYDVERDFQPVSLLVHLPNLLVVNTKLSAKTVPELIEHLRASDGKVNYGSSGNGTSSHLSAVMFQLASGTKMTHVPFRSTADELNSMVGGHIDLAIDSMTTLWPQAQAGVVRAIAVTSAKRVPTAPDLPTIGETLNGFSVSGWQGLFAPAGTPRPIVDKIAAEVKRIFELPEVVTALKNVGGEPSPMSPDEFAQSSRANGRSGGTSSKRRASRSIDQRGARLCHPAAYCGSIFASATSSPQRLISRAKSSRKVSGVPGNGSLANLVRNSVVSGMATMRSKDDASLSTIGCGVPAGRKTPHHGVSSMPG